MKDFLIGRRKIGNGHPCFIIAEAGVNHNGSLQTAIDLIEAASDAGADAVKFQTFKAENLVTRSAPIARYQKKTMPDEESSFSMLKRLELDLDSCKVLAEHCRKKNILFLSSPFDEESIDLLARINMAVFKIPSGELTNHALIRHAASKQKPLIISTGMAITSEIEKAVTAAKSAGNEEIVLLHCVTAYPTPPEDANLNAIAEMKRIFDLPVGYSDHTTGIDIALAGVALGACILEKHFTLSRTMPGPDHATSIEPEELKQLIAAARRIQVAMGSGVKLPAPSEIENITAARKSLVTKHSIPSGRKIDYCDITAKRPAGGIPPDQIDMLIGRETTEEIPEDTTIRWSMIR